MEGKYRYGYQGQYSERDQETNWNHFELREYDRMTGRWTTRDPKKQFYSGYLGMGNNPVNGVDPDGGLFGIDLTSISNTINSIKSMQFNESATAHLYTNKFGDVPKDFLKALHDLKFSSDDVTRLLIEMRDLEQSGASDNTREYANSRITFNVSDGSKFTTYNFVIGPMFIPGNSAANANPVNGIATIIRGYNSNNQGSINGGNLVLDVVAHTHNVVSPGITFGGKPSRNDIDFHINNKVGLSIILNTRNNVMYYLKNGSKTVHSINNSNSIFK